jgi:hypothetical protein
MITMKKTVIEFEDIDVWFTRIAKQKTDEKRNRFFVDMREKAEA